MLYIIEYRIVSKIGTTIVTFSKYLFFNKLFIFHYITLLIHFNLPI